MHLTWYSSTRQKGDSDFSSSAAMRTPLIGWMHVGPLQRHMYHSQYFWCPSDYPRLVFQAVAKSPTHRLQCHVCVFSLLQLPNNTTTVKRSKIRKWWLTPVFVLSHISQIISGTCSCILRVRTQVDLLTRESWQDRKVENKVSL